MNHDLKWELLAIGIAAGIALIILIPAFLYARTQARDHLRVEDITNLKQAVEVYHNDREYYPTPPKSKPHCTDSRTVDSWFFGPQSPIVKGQYIDVSPHDIRESDTQYYRYCVTDIRKGEAKGYFFEASLELPQNDVIAFDEDETRKFDYRILHEDDKALYRVCGGTETQCRN
ncbi:MAG: hypothetical protein HYR90_03040 [Candidatus Andersenbacteria bacterium]|nr:hypothetical protein [Candidatus Andersenbacteria bacterium]MBI3250238.1 hypothetical protein [Candidatus Andersenbacteria bacterium]